MIHDSWPGDLDYVSDLDSDRNKGKGEFLIDINIKIQRESILDTLS